MINPTAGSVTIENHTGDGFPENTTAQYIQAAPKKAQINAPRALPFNWPPLIVRTLETALVVWPMRSSAMFLRESSTENSVSHRD